MKKIKNNSMFKAVIHNCIDLFNKIRYFPVSEQETFECYIPCQDLLEQLSKWMKKETYGSKNLGIVGLLKRNGSFTIHYRFKPIISNTGITFNYFYLIRGAIRKSSDNSCIVEYRMFYDRLIKLLYIILGLGCFSISAQVVKDILIPEGITDGFQIFLLALALLLVGLGIRFFLPRKYETEEEGKRAIHIFEDFLLHYRKFST